MTQQPDLFTHEAAAHGGYRKSDPETSKEAGEAMTGEKLTDWQYFILCSFRNHGQMTDEELVSMVYPHAHGESTLRSRRSELVRKGLLRDSGQRKKNRGGRQTIIWEIVR